MIVASIAARLPRKRLAAPLLFVMGLAACTEPLSTVANRHENPAPTIPVVTAAPAENRMVAIDPVASDTAIVAFGEEQEIAAVETTPGPQAPAAHQNGSSNPAKRQQSTAKRTTPAEPSKPIFDTDRLVGLGRDQVLALLGAPDLLRRDPPAELWLYEGQSCTAHLFLYQSPAGSAYEVRHFETQEGKQASECFASLVASSGSGSQVGALR